MSSDIYIVSKFNDGHMNEIGDKLTKKDNGLYWNHRTKSTVNVHMDNCIKLSEAIEALEKVGQVQAIRKELNSMPAIFDRRYGGMFVDRDYLKRFIDSLDK